MISQEDKALLKAFVQNKPLMDAVRRAMTSKIYQHGGVETSTKNFVFSLYNPAAQKDEEFGRKVSIIVQALYELEGAFQEMVLAVEAPDKKTEKKNQAR